MKKTSQKTSEEIAKEIVSEIETQDWVLNYWQVLFIKQWDYQAYCKNPISNSDWLVIKPEIKDKRFLWDLSLYKENGTTSEKIYKAYSTLKKRAKEAYRRYKK